MKVHFDDEATSGSEPVLVAYAYLGRLWVGDPTRFKLIFNPKATPTNATFDRK